jgi:hypothetical protein
MTIAILYHRSSSVLSYCYLYSIILYGVPYINSDVPFLLNGGTRNDGLR